MINKEKLISYLEENGIEEIEELKVKNDLVVLRLFYDFDEDEIKAATAYANDEESDEESDEWNDEYYLPYLNDVAVDNVGSIIEDSFEEFDIEGQFASYDVDKENSDYCEFIAAFFEKDSDYDLDEIIDELNL
ncbi:MULTISPECIES: hypothetical protein [Clostridium]|uniref:Uncharacterized protein n=1 Tax=Clostridium cadaveris TaxID=1529 RepID=A0A1I2MUG4_9CLOT|nr:hypothetical protein [Clostridium cadaveris]MDM8311915.1 hypothetical protein [Clostridium cadaveris]MDU4953420.1 hypothetical protein [Clostridium sp.]MDY4948701.1 hypothetical protein [Clostridium cadaveris]SFF95225.1 hypothetical protein SAMN04487885_11722 [Clostridium cadaveris]